METIVGYFEHIYLFIYYLVQALNAFSNYYEVKLSTYYITHSFLPLWCNIQQLTKHPAKRIPLGIAWSFCIIMTSAKTLYFNLNAQKVQLLPLSSLFAYQPLLRALCKVWTTKMEERVKLNPWSWCWELVKVSTLHVWLKKMTQLNNKIMLDIVSVSLL